MTYKKINHNILWTPSLHLFNEFTPSHHYIEIPYNLDIADKTRQNLIRKTDPKNSLLPFSLSLSNGTPPNVSQPMWNSFSKPKSSQDGVFNNRRTLQTTNETTPARGGSDGTQRV